MATNSARINASRTAVFGVLSDGWKYSNWVVGTSHMRAVEEAWPAVGSKLYHASGAWPLTERAPCALETTIPRLFAAGDVRSSSTKRVGFAVGDGALAVACVHSLR